VSGHVEDCVERDEDHGCEGRVVGDETLVLLNLFVVGEAPSPPLLPRGTGEAPV
jgi:hypothetical protein